jgi:GATA zinc finger
MRVTPEEKERRQQQRSHQLASPEANTKMSVATAQLAHMPTSSYEESKSRLPPLSSMLPPLKPRMSTGATNSPYSEYPRATMSTKEIDTHTPDIQSRTSMGRPMIDRSESDSRFNPGLSDGSSEISEYRHGLSRSPNERAETDGQATIQHGSERPEVDGQLSSSYHGSQSSEIDGHASSYRGYGRPSWSAKEHDMQDSRDRMSSMSIQQSVPSPAYLSPAMASANHPSYSHPRARTSTSDGQVFASNRSAQSPPPSATTRFSSDPYSMDDFSTVSSSSSLRAPSQHFYRSQVRSSAKPYEIASASSAEMELFNQLWDVMMEVRRQIERFQSKTSAAGPRPLPSIRDGDVATLTSHLHYEIDVLSEADGRTADHFALDVRHLHDQFSQRKQNMRARSSTISMVTNRERASISHYYPHQPYLSSSSTSPPMHPRGSASSSSQIPQAASYTSSMPSGYGEAPSSAPPVPRGQELYYPTYDYHRREYGNQGRDMINQRIGVYDRRASSGYATPIYDVRFTSGLSSPQDEMRSMSSGHLGPASVFHAHQQGRISQAMPRRVRKRRDEAEQSCLSCSAKETPEWRKGPTGPRTLCNACGLLYAKQCRKRELDLQARGKRQRGSRTGGGDEMTQEERESSPLELQLAVQSRINQSNPVTMGSSDGIPPSSFPGSNTTNEIGSSVSSGMSRAVINPNQQAQVGERSTPSLPSLMRH